MGTRIEWVQDFLAGGGWPTTDDNVRAVLAWCRSEFGDSTPAPAAFNLLASEQDAPGATAYNDVGVKNYPDWPTGVRACVATLQQDHPGYQSVRDHLVAGHDASATCAAVSASAWGSHPTDGMLAEVATDPAHNAELFVGDRPDVHPVPTPSAPTTVEDDMGWRVFTASDVQVPWFITWLSPITGGRVKLAIDQATAKGWAAEQAFGGVSGVFASVDADGPHPHLLTNAELEVIPDAPKV